MDKRAYREDCSGHGRSVLGRCRCDRFYHGARCQYHEECLDDSDCGTQGACVDNGGTTPPTKHCYCNIGWFGPGCSKREYTALCSNSHSSLAEEKKRKNGKQNNRRIESSLS